MSLAGGLAAAVYGIAVLAPTAPAMPLADNDPQVSMTAVNWGRPASLLDPAHPVYSHFYARSTFRR